MQLAFNLQGAGFTADIIDTTSEVVLENGTITTINLTTSVKAKVWTKLNLRNW
jgi:osmotically inducible protein OsmC